MPVYEYKCTHPQCKDWGKRIEVFQKMEDDPLKTCETCKQDTLLKLISRPSVGAVIGVGDTTTVTNGDDGKPYRFKSGTVAGQKKELRDLLNRREEGKPDWMRKQYDVD